ncbi:hypothetical protein CVT26_012514 [Gymnopilus dilepis]|uniref:Uncharacterized protein n=1 Tax=Gymnopilus dilepis TaxID=231916 RepID=A0A409YW48_9AGAR|nr:hypothetical protein CVT26_012514 [Gymnopilus dilepis]
MPKHYQKHQEKLAKSVKALKGIGWRSTNDFVQAFYEDPALAAQSLRLQPGTAYAPEAILAAWIAQVPSGAGAAELNMAITRKATTIMVAESTEAYHHPELRLSSTNLDIAYLTTDFGLKRLSDLYISTLPCLSYMLQALLTAENDYERWNEREKIGKDVMALKFMLISPQITVAIISMLLFFRNRATNAFQIIMGVFLASSGASRRIIDTFNHMGLCVSYKWVP